MGTEIKNKCNKCGYEQVVNPWFSNWQCSKCKTHWICPDECEEDAIKTI